MKEKLKRIIAGLLFAVMIVSGVPSAAVYAEEDSVKVESQDTEASQSEEQDAAQNEQESEIVEEDKDIVQDGSEEDVLDESENETTDEESNAIINNDTASENNMSSVQTEQEDDDLSQEETSPEQEESEASTGTVNFVYIEKPYLTTPDTQRIVFAFDEEFTDIDTLSLIVEDESGNRSEWPMAKERNGLYLFEKEFTGEAYTGTYRAVSLKLTVNDESEVLDLAAMDIQAEFGVNEEYDGYDELQPMDGEAAAEDMVDASVVTIDENGVTEAQDDIVDALSAASLQTTGISTFSRAARTAAEPKTGNIIVALDPGHDSRSTGASANGLKEEVLTLKIANYCKEELEQYAGVEVYMTRTDADCPFDMNGAGCIEKRVNAAADAGAQIYVSIHLNSSTSSGAKGAEVIIQNDNWRPEVAEESATLAEKILDELVALGLNERDIYSKNSQSGDKYADGSLSDYFSVNRNCKLRNIPGIIVEHAFLTNSSDVNNFLKTESGLKKLGVADATGIAKYLGLSKGYWETDEDGNTYYYENGKKVFGEKHIGGKWYYFDSQTGVMVTGWHDFANKTVYYGVDGAMIYGEQNIGGKWYYFDEIRGSMITGWHEFADKTVYYGIDGAMVYGEQNIGGKWYYFDEIRGSMAKGWHEFADKTVYYGIDGAMVYGEQNIGGKWYYFDVTRGTMVTGWYDFADKTVYYGTDGAMVYGEQNIGGKWYYFDEIRGSMVTGWHEFADKTVYYGTDGAMVYGEQNIGGKWYYFDETRGFMVTGWHDFGTKKVYYNIDGTMVYGDQMIDGKKYYFNAVSGALYFGERLINGKWYYYDEKAGFMVTGWHDFPNKTVYYDATGAMVYGIQTIEGEKYYFISGTGALYFGERLIDGKWHYFDENTGAMVTGWHKFPNKTVYYDETGGMVYGERNIGNKWHYFVPGTGAMVTGWHVFPNKTVYYNSNGEMVYGEQIISGKWYYLDTTSGAMLTNTWINGKYYGVDGVRVETSTSELTKIVGTSQTTVDQMVKYYQNNYNKKYPYPQEELSKGGAENIGELAKIFYEEATREDVRAEVAWAQTMKETGYLKFGGDVSVTQFNFAGIGATGDVAGADFSGYGSEGVRMGVRAQIQHLKAYATAGLTKSELKTECVDPRFDYVAKGSAIYVEWLGIQENPYGTGWAVAEGYGIQLAEMVDALCAIPC